MEKEAFQRIAALEERSAKEKKAPQTKFQKNEISLDNMSEHKNEGEYTKD